MSEPSAPAGPAPAAAPPPAAARRPAAPGKKKRGRESVGDMVRSLGLVMLIVVPIWFFAQPPESDSQVLRVVDPGPDVALLLESAPGVPVPRALPAGWRSTSSTLDPQGLRIGWVTPSGEYAEYAASSRPEFVNEITGGGAQVAERPIGGATWRQYVDGDDHTTLVREAAGRTVAVGGVRETATLAELEQLAGATR